MNPYKTCTMCGKVWRSQIDFLSDLDITFEGYQPSFEQMLAGFFLFTHKACKSTLAIPAGSFQHLYNGPIFQERSSVTEKCPECCLNIKNPHPCPAYCECAYIIEIINILTIWLKDRNRAAIANKRTCC